MNNNFGFSGNNLLQFLTGLAREIALGRRLPPIPNLQESWNGILEFAGLVRGTLVIGKPGTGKTRFIAALVVAYILAFPDQGAIVLDASGPLIIDILAITRGLSPGLQEKVRKRLVVDILGHPEYTQTLPEFHRDYDVPLEKQIQRVAENLRRLNPKTMELGMLGKPALEEMAPELFRLLCAVENEYKETYQITEAKNLLMDGSQMAMALSQFGGRVPQAKWYFEQFTKKRVSGKEYEMRSFTLRSALGVIEPRDMRARLGFYKPSWTPAEAAKKGLIVLVSGELMLDQELQLNYLFTQIYSLFRQEMNRRKPNDPNDKPFLFVIDEAPITFKVPGLAREIGEISTFYRSRKLWLIIIVQALWQLAKELQDQVWSLGNLVSFAVEDVEDARRIAEQLFHYSPQMVKQEARTVRQNPVTEPDHGQYAMHANWIQSFRQRELVMRRYFDEARQDHFVRHVARTPEVPSWNNREEIEDLKLEIFKERAIPIRDALEVVNKRHLTPAPKKPQQPPKM